MKRSFWQEVVLFVQFMIGKHPVVREREVLI
jgi:hypothetical protein